MFWRKSKEGRQYSCSLPRPRESREHFNKSILKMIQETDREPIRLGEVRERFIDYIFTVKAEGVHKLCFQNVGESDTLVFFDINVLNRNLNSSTSVVCRL